MARYRKSHVPDLASRLRSMGPSLVDVATARFDAFSDAEARIFRDKILAQRFVAFDKLPLSEEWVRRKRRHGRSTRTMLATKYYVQQIQVHRTRGKRTHKAFIGHAPQLLAHDLDGVPVAGIPLQLLAAVHEFGTADGRIPARPHWGPQLVLIQTRARHLRKRLSQELTGMARGVIGGKH